MGARARTEANPFRYGCVDAAKSIYFKGILFSRGSTRVARSFQYQRPAWGNYQTSILAAEWRKSYLNVST
jgi:hypothetical protein